MAKGLNAKMMASIATNKKKRSFVKGYNFFVFFDENLFSFSRISSIERQIQTESFIEGGMNGRGYIISKPTRTENVMTFERGIKSSVTKDSNPLVPGYKIDSEVGIYVLDDSGVPYKGYFLSGAMVRKVSIGEFDAQRSELLIEKVEIVYDFIEEKNML